MNAEIRCVVFDFDGTLVDSNSIKRDAYFEVTRRFGDVRALVTETLGVARGDRAANLREILERFDREGKLPPEKSADEWLSLVVEEYAQWCEARIRASAEIPGARAALEQLAAAGFALFVNSATPTEPLRRVVQLRDLHSFFRGIYGAPAAKAENLAVIQRETGVPYSAMLVVGDGEEDRLAAEKTGCAFLGIVSTGGGFSVPPRATAPDLRSLVDFVIPKVSS
jgi:phosphoglycolate phosphatase-like HAD superfamily hydrolase